MTKLGDTGRVGRPGDNVHIPLPFEEAMRGLLKVKPTKDYAATRSEVDQSKKEDSKGEETVQPITRSHPARSGF